MKKSILAAALFGSAVMASTAFADVALPTSGNGEFTLFVRDEVTQNVYARGLQININNFLTEAASSTTYTGAPTAVSYSIPTIAADANLAAFLAGVGSHEVTWGVVAADTVGSNSAVTPRRLVTTTQADVVANGSIPSNSTLTSTVGSVNVFLGSVNGNLPGSTIGDGSSVAGSADSGGLWGNSGTAGAAAQNTFASGILDYSDIGTTMHLYLFTSETPVSGSGNALASRVFQALDITLASNGTLQAVAAPAVPLPAAVWLLGSGLLGLLGIGRRRATNVSATAA